MTALPLHPSDLAAWVSQALSHLQGRSALVVGDLLLDEYLYGEADRISPEAPVPVVRLTRSEIRLGGAGNVARNLAALGATPLLAGLLGPDATGAEIRDLWAGLGFSTDALIEDPTRCTPRKTRVLVGTQQLLRLDLEPAHMPESPAALSLLPAITAAMASCQVALFSDYQKGSLGPAATPALIAAARATGAPVLANPKPVSAGWFRGASLLSVNRSEALALLPLEQRPADPIEAGALLRELLAVEQLLITRGAQGMALFTADGHWLMPAVASEIFDVTGAGDTVLATLGLALGAGLRPEAAMLLATYAAGVVVRKVGVATSTPTELADLAAQRPLLPHWEPRAL